MTEILVIRKVVGLAGLVYLSIEDIRKREVWTFAVFLIGAAGVVLSLLGGAWNGWGVLGQFVPGLLCLLAGRISRQSIGYGDGLVLLCLGCYLTLSQLLEVCMSALTFAGIAALFLLCVMRKGKRATLPLVPFFLAGYVISWLNISFI